MTLDTSGAVIWTVRNGGGKWEHAAAVNSITELPGFLFQPPVHSGRQIIRLKKAPLDMSGAR